MPKTSMTSSPKPSVPLVSSILHTQYVHGEDRMTDTNSNSLPRHPGITQSTPVTMVTTGDTNVTPDSSSALHATEHKGLNLQPAGADSTPNCLLLYLGVRTVHNLQEQIMVGMSQPLHHCLALECFYPKRVQFC